MPELPEVEYVARQLRADLVGHTIEHAEVRWPRSIERASPREFVEQAAGRTISAVGRRGKYLLLYLDNDTVLVVHRRMSGNLMFASDADAQPYVRVAFALEDGRWLLYTDPRKFGRLALVARASLDEVFTVLGPEPLDESFTVDALAERLAARRGPIKAVLLDQTVVAGLGNIYTDEALFRAGIHPLQPASSLSRGEVAALRTGIQEALQTGIAHGGTTFGRHRDAYNEAGRNLEHVQVYRRTGECCMRCGMPIQRIVVAQRGTHFCPSCQRPRPQADSGMIASELATGG
jgi:formamidopyrimidine-DNA glycosylase